jgi:hypothetical protein
MEACEWFAHEVKACLKGRALFHGARSRGEQEHRTTHLEPE